MLEIQYLNSYMMKLIDIRVYFCLMLVSLLCGCTTPSTNAGPTTHSKTKTQALQQAEKYKRLAGKEHTDVAANYRLRASEQLVIAGQPDQALKLMEENNKRRLNTENTVYRQIIWAKIALAKQDPAAAKTHLSSIWTPLKLPEYLKVKFYSTKADAYVMSGDPVEAINERVFLAKNIHTPADKTVNNIAIWNTLNALPQDTLENIHSSNSNTDLKGWVTFVTITKQYNSNHSEMTEALSQWKEAYPDHAAISFMRNAGPAAIQAQPQQAVVVNTNPYTGRKIESPRKIALLLPLQGTHAQTAQAVRDGFLTAYYAQADGPSKPKIQIYDTTQQANISDSYQLAVDEGADFIVGPLIKEQVEEVNNSLSPRIPVLALNISQKQSSHDNVFQFSLSPEMEAQAVADRAWRDGHRNALIIAPKSAWGQRMVSAFTERWNSLGGQVLASQQIVSQSNVNKEVQHLLAIDSSTERAKQLKQLGLKFNFDPSRRQDADMIFIATNAALARQVKPLLNFYYAGKLPAYASSSVFSGKIQPNLDQDLNGIKFCDMPWVLDNAMRTRSALKPVNPTSNFDQYSRLYALGLDAYKIAMQIDQLTSLPELGLTGMTGTLTLDRQQYVQRKLMWASFRKGTPAIEGGQF